MPAELAQRYKSPAQQARVVSETWGQENLYCAACASPKLAATPVGTQVVDYTCPQCDSAYQLKSQSRPFSRRITDAAYDAMVRAIRQGRTPNLFALHYDLHRWAVLNLILVPRFAFSLSCIEKRNPLRTAAERHGWVGCNILLGGIPPDARIPVVVNGVPNRVASVREQYARLRPLEKIRYDARGWTLDVLNVVRRLDKKEFKLGDVYACAGELARLHPQNKNVEPKIRQQLQRLRDLGFLEFTGRGVYRVL
ncbi:MAG: restriction endonuclease [Acidobacteria bacterium]|nr:MAG: restriction endonuclease [Acidobacteriota bacterium]